MGWIKIIFFNIFITFGLLGILLLAPPIANLVYSLLTFNAETDNSAQDYRPSLDLYNGIDWAQTHFNEYKNLKTKYYDYITWRSNDFEGETINIIDGLRVSNEPNIFNSKEDDYLFFGGSTTWGVGVNDENTYPSIFAERLNTHVTNFGESSYIARQSLGLLTNFLVDNSLSNLSGKHIIFYDGVNDVAERCRSEIRGLSTSREQQIQSIISLNRNKRYSFGKTFEQLTELLHAAFRRLGLVNELSIANETYICSTDSKRAKEIAKTLVETWKVASDLVTQRGGKFTAILQPLAFIGSPKIDYLELTSANDIALRMQYETVYPLIRQIAASANIHFIDLTSVYDNCEDCYIDFCHVGPQAHQLLVERLLKSING